MLPFHVVNAIGNTGSVLVVGALVMNMQSALSTAAYSDKKYRKCFQLLISVLREEITKLVIQFIAYLWVSLQQAQYLKVTHPKDQQTMSKRWQTSTILCFQ